MGDDVAAMPRTRLTRTPSGHVVFSGSQWQGLEIGRVLAAPLVLAPIAWVIEREIAGLQEMLFAMGLAFVGYLIWRLTKIRDALRVEIGPKEVHARRRGTSGFVSREAIRAVYVAEIPRASGWDTSHRLVVALEDGSHQELARTFDPALALAARRAIEQELALRPGSVETPGAIDAAPRASVVPKIQLGASVVLIAFVTWQTLSSGVAIATLEVTDAPARASFSFDAPAEIVLHAEVHYRDAVPPPLPDALEYEVTLANDQGTLATWRCDPYAVDTMIWRTGSGRHIRAFERELPGCAQRLPAAGNYSITARRAWRIDPAASKIVRTKILVHER